MSFLSLAKQTQIIAGLVEGNSIRSMERATGAHRDTIMRLALRVGEGCAKIMDEEMRDLTCQRIQADEIWAFVGKKARTMTPADDPAKTGDFYTFVALDADSKLVPCYRVGKRNRDNTHAFVQDLAGRLSNRCQLSTDAFSAYVDAVEEAFGADVDYGQIVKYFEAERAPGSGRYPSGRYSPPRVVGADRVRISGGPDYEHISTSYVERQNLHMRMSMRRFTRLTNGFSKKLEGLKAAVALHFANYNFCHVHSAIRMTPAMAAGVSARIWPLEELVERTAWTGSPE